MPRKLLKETKKTAKESGMTQSEFFRVAVRQYLAEDLEMYGSQKLRKDIAKARKEKETVTLEELEKKYNL